MLENALHIEPGEPPARDGGRRGALLAPSSAARHKTPLAFAEWLVAIARTADLSRPFRREPRQIGLFGEGLAAQ